MSLPFWSTGDVSKCMSGTKMFNFVASTVPIDRLATSDARAFTGTAMTGYGSLIFLGLALAETRNNTKTRDRILLFYLNTDHKVSYKLSGLRSNTVVIRPRWEEQKEWAHKYCSQKCKHGLLYWGQVYRTMNSGNLGANCGHILTKQFWLYYYMLCKWIWFQRQPGLKTINTRTYARYCIHCKFLPEFFLRNLHENIRQAEWLRIMSYSNQYKIVINWLAWTMDLFY